MLSIGLYIYNFIQLHICIYTIQYKIYNFRHYPLFSLLFKTRRFGDWILSPFSGGRHSFCLIYKCHQIHWRVFAIICRKLRTCRTVTKLAMRHFWGFFSKKKKKKLNKSEVNLVRKQTRHSKQRRLNFENKRSR
jgi:hypothetical protein